MKSSSKLLLIIGGVFLLARDTSAVSTTSATLQYWDYYSDGGALYTETGATGDGAPVSAFAENLNVPAERNAPSGQVQVSVGSIRFGGESPGPSFLQAGVNKLAFTGIFFDSLTIPVGPGGSGSVTVSFRLDGEFDPDSQFAGYGNAPSAWVGGSVRAQAGGSGGVVSLGEPFAWDLSAVPYGETDTLSASATERFVANSDQFVDSGLQSVTFRYSNDTDLKGFFYFGFYAGFSGYVVGEGEIDFMNTFSASVTLSENVPFTTASGETSYVHVPAHVPDAGRSLVLTAFASGVLLAVRRIGFHGRESMIGKS